MLTEVLLCLLVAAAAYLLGCISTGTLIANAAGVDIHKLGSRSTGASNVLRVLGLKKGLLTFVGDSVKALLACLLGDLLAGNALGIAGLGMMLGAFFVVIGHNWPVFFGFKGGKGVACSVAVLLYCDPLAGAIAIALCVAVIAITRYISLGSMVMLLSYFILGCMLRWGEWPVLAFRLVLLVLCIYRHHANIDRLRKGTENKIGKRVDPNAAAETAEK